MDRFYPDGTWEANLFQYYIRTLPRLESSLPEPFSIQDIKRIDQSQTHIVIREVFVNLCLQPEVLDELSRILGLDAQKLSSQVQTVLALALTEKHVTNERLRFVLRLHKSDITSLLQQMCKQGWLVSNGYGRGTKYRLPSRETIDKVVTNEDNVDSLTPNVDSLTPNVDSLTPNVDSLTPNVDSSEDNIKIILGESGLSEEARALLKRKRLSQSQMEVLICEIASEWRTIQDITLILGKDKSYLRNHVLPNLISKGVLEREYMSIPNHPNQRYRKKV